MLEGKGEVANDNVFFPLYPLAPQDLPQRDKDIDMAKQLLTEAGYADGVDMELTVEDYEEIHSTPLSPRRWRRKRASTSRRSW